MFKDLAKYACKGFGTVVYSLGYITFFKHWSDKSMAPVCGEFTSFNGSVKDYLNEMRNPPPDSSLRTNGLILTGPAALPGFRLLRSFIMPEIEIWNSGMVGIELWGACCIESGLNLPQSAMSWVFMCARRARLSGERLVNTD